MKENFPNFCSIEQANKIYELLNGTPEEGSLINSYTVGDIFKYLPYSITYNGHRGDLSVSTEDIAYFSIGGEWKHVLVHHESIPLGGDIFDAFINMITWIKKNNLM